MSFTAHQPDQIRYYTSDILPDNLVVQAFFTRIGGVSQGVHSSLNMGLTVGDDPKNVYRNREIAFAALGRPINSLSDSWLVHGKESVVYHQPRSAAEAFPPKADIILTDNSEVTLFMRFADCTPIALVDPVKRAVALAHAGWRGTVDLTAKRAVEKMEAVYNTNPKDLVAVIGPAIGPARYEVGPEVVEAVRDAFGVDAAGLLPENGNSIHFDLWRANQLALEQAGVTQIANSGVCTYDHADEWFSHRASGGQTGRFGVLLALKE